MSKKVAKKELKNVSFEVASEIDKSFDDSRFTKVALRVAHDGVNPNGSHFSLEAMEMAKDTLANIPILANVVEDENGNIDYGAHDISIEENKLKEGEYKLIYKEIPIGLIPFQNEYKIEEFEGRNYVTCVGYIWNEYSNYSLDILESKEEVKISMEISVDSWEEWSEDKNYFDIKSYKYTGITFLGDKYGTGMLEAKAEKVEFNIDESKEVFLKMAEELKFALENHNADETVEVETEVTEVAETETVVEPEATVEVAPEGEVIETIEEPAKFEWTADEKLEMLNKELGGYRESEGLYEDYYVMTYDSTYAYIRVWSYDSNESKYNDYYLRCPYSMEDDRYTADISMAEKVYATYITKAEREKLESDRNAMVADYEKTIESFKADIESKDKTITELNTFKTNVEKEIKTAEVEDLLGEFESVLKGSEEFDKLKEKAIDMEIQELEKELYALEGMLKHEKKNKKDKKSNFSRVAIDFGYDGEVNGDDKEDKIRKYYGDASKYFVKK